MPLDQASSATLANLAHSFLRFLGEEAQEGHHPPNAGQHQQSLGGAPGTADVNEPASYRQNPAMNTPGGGNMQGTGIQSAGIPGAGGMLLLAPDGRALFVRRAANARDHAGAWSIPGGMTEGDELPWQTALRETHEEVGDIGNPNMQLLDHNIMDGVGFTTFGGRVNDAFRPTLNDEHDGFQWARPDQAPQPLHPGLASTLKFAQDPLTEKGSKIMSSMKSQYGPEKGERVFYASKNKGTISGVDDSYNTTGRQDTQIPRPHPVNSKLATPFNANVDQGQMVTAPSSAPPALANRTRDGWQSPRQDAAPRTTQIKALQPAAGKQVAATAGSKAMFPGRRVRGRDVVGGVTPPTQKGANDLSRFVLRDTATDTEYAIDQPLPAEFKPFSKANGSKANGSKANGSKANGSKDCGDGGDCGWRSPSQDGEVTEDAGGVAGAGGWSHGGLAPPTQPGANDLNTDPTAPAGTPSMSPPALPSGGRGGGTMGGTSQGMPGGPMAMNGPKFTQTYKVQLPDGTTDERKVTRVGAPPQGHPPALQPQGWQQQDVQQPQQQPQWASPPQDRGWPTAGTLGPSPMGGRAGSRGGGGGAPRL